MKKLIVGLTSIMGITLTASAVVSCGVSFDSLLKRKVDTNEFKGYFQFNPNSLVSAKTMVAQDFELISDLNVGLASADQFGRTIGELAVKYEPAYTDATGVAHDGTKFVGKRTENAEGNTKGTESWTYLINKNAQWSDFNNRTQGKIKGTDFLNIFLYISHPSTASETKSFWTSYIHGASEIINYIDNGDTRKEVSTTAMERYTEVYNKIAEMKKSETGTFDGMEGITIGTQTFKLGITSGIIGDLKDENLKNHPAFGIGDNDLIDNDSYYITWTGLDGMPMPFFDSLMTYASFAPLPDTAVDLSDKAKDGAFSNYMLSSNFESTALFSGPFILKKLQASQSIEYVKNEAYVNKKDVHFNKLIKTFKSKATDGELRTSFESGDLTELKLRPTDPQGWNTYVGSDPTNPKFSGVTVEDSKAQATYGIYMNTINTSLWNPTPTGDAELNTRVLTSSVIRNYLMTTIQKSWMSKYYSSAFDKKGERHISATNVNTLTPTNFAFDDNGKDYVQYLAREISGQEDLPDKDSDLFKSIKPGGDFYSYHKDVIEGEVGHGKSAPLGYEIKRDLKNQTNEEYLSEVKEELSEISNGQSVTLSQLTNGARSNTENIYTQNMIDIFNESAKEDGVDIKIVQDQTNDESEFKSKRNTAQYDLLITGWSPDFSDPVSYLNTHKLNGDLANYFGLHRIIDANKAPKILAEWKKGKEANESFGFKYSDLEKLGVLNNSYKTNDSATKDQMAEFVSDISEYSELVETASSESKLDKRYTDFAKAEKLLLIDKSLMIPVYDPWVLPSVKMSFIMPYSFSTVGYGSTQYVHRGWEILSSMPTLNGGYISKAQEAYKKYMAQNNGQIPNSGLKLATLDKNTWKFAE